MANEIEAQGRRNQRMNRLLRDDRRAIKGLPPEEPTQPAGSPSRPPSVDAGAGTSGSPRPEEPNWNEVIRQQIAERPE